MKNYAIQSNTNRFTADLRNPVHDQSFDTTPNDGDSENINKQRDPSQESGQGISNQAIANLNIPSSLNNLQSDNQIISSDVSNTKSLEIDSLVNSKHHQINDQKSFKQHLVVLANNQDQQSNASKSKMNLNRLSEIHKNIIVKRQSTFAPDLLHNSNNGNPNSQLGEQMKKKRNSFGLMNSNPQQQSQRLSILKNPNANQILSIKPMLDESMQDYQNQNENYGNQTFEQADKRQTFFQIPDQNQISVINEEPTVFEQDLDITFVSNISQKGGGVHTRSSAGRFAKSSKSKSSPLLKVKIAHLGLSKEQYQQSINLINIYSQKDYKQNTMAQIQSVQLLLQDKKQPADIKAIENFAQLISSIDQIDEQLMVKNQTQKNNDDQYNQAFSELQNDNTYIEKRQRFIKKIFKNVKQANDPKYEELMDLSFITNGVADQKMLELMSWSHLNQKNTEQIHNLIMFNQEIDEQIKKYERIVSMNEKKENIFVDNQQIHYHDSQENLDNQIQQFYELNQLVNKQLNYLKLISPFKITSLGNHSFELRFEIQANLSQNSSISNNGTGQRSFVIQIVYMNVNYLQKIKIIQDPTGGIIQKNLEQMFKKVDYRVDQFIDQILNLIRQFEKQILQNHSVK
ncbi:UNKNOWN [Stylonychia lemnae]|uniref:Uncharacterized protein n=1 Tax=Stylonychia lemnae TaxID=5949 RepID=A0A078AU74_STYLE|nr:UNKNOWN [Stylonychia lemnae]|eukprot:CDW85960.1 UNKNOWN [Stylonychia lemnae]